MKLILTVPAYAQFARFAQDKAVESVRLNTTLPVKAPLEAVLNRIKAKAEPKDVWIDLKCRQLRITNYYVQILNDKEIHYIDLSHKIKVKTPTKIYIDDGNYVGKIEHIINGNKLVVPSSVEKKRGLPLANQGKVGIRPSMSINILHPSLQIEGYLTDRDKKYIEAAKKAGLHNYMLSYVEHESDITDVLGLDTDAKIVAKIESKKGLDFVRNIYPKYKDKVNLMAARGDLYIEVEKPDQIIDACEEIISADPYAMFASRLFESLKDVNKAPKCQDLFDIYCGMQMGYKRFLLGDDVCSRRDSVDAAIGLFDVMREKYERNMQSEQSEKSE